MLELLFAPEVALGRLNRDGPEEELDLIQRPSLLMARNTVPSVMLNQHRGNDRPSQLGRRRSRDDHRPRARDLGRWIGH